jgi:aryl-alcohol dehydrogenase-like predicted oxidoreductase
MERRKVGRSDLELPVITFGAWAIGGLFWGGADDQEAIEAIEAAITNGIDAVDTAPIYGCGHSETLVGRALAGRRREVKILTKCGLRWDDTSAEFYFELQDTPYGRPVTVYKNVKAGSIIRECEESLKRLQTDHIDLYQVHWPSKSAPAEETMGALNRLQEQGKILHYGVSNYNAHQMAEASRHGSMVSNQIKYNLLERGIEADALPYCRKHKIGVLAYSPMAMGLLTGKVTPERIFPKTDVRSADRLYSTDNRRKVAQALEQVRPIAEAHGASFGQLAVAWVAAQPGICSVLVGARNAAQTVENAAAGKIRLSEEESGKLRRLFEGLGNLRA